MQMSGRVLIVVFWTFLQSFARGDVEVSCVFMETCILPCSFQSGSDAVIHWIQETAGNPAVHSYYYNQDQVKKQDQHFRDRTSLFKDQISAGNASLQLTGVVIQDQGRYKCYTSTSNSYQNLFINLKVDAPIRKVDIQQEENRITCSSEGIYPEPELTWSISPPSNMTFKNTTTVQQTEEQLYNINGSLLLPDSVTDLLYICNVSTRRNTKGATLLKPKKEPDVDTNPGAVVGVVVGIVSVVIIGLAAFCIYKRQGTRANANAPESIQMNNMTENGEEQRPLEPNGESNHST